MTPATDLAMGILFLIVSGTFTFLAMKFMSLKGTIILSIGEMGALMVLLARYDQIETDADKVARILKMSPEEVKTEMEKGRIMHLIGMKAAEVMATLRAAIPDANRMISEYERELER